MPNGAALAGQPPAGRRASSQSASVAGPHMDNPSSGCTSHVHKDWSLRPQDWLGQVHVSHCACSGQMGPAEEMQLSTKQTHYESPSCTALKHLAEATRAAGKATALRLAAQRPACNIGQQLHATSSGWAEPLWTQLSHFSQHVISAPQPQASAQLRQGSG